MVDTILILEQSVIFNFDMWFGCSVFILALGERQCVCVFTSFPYRETLSAAKTVAVLANSFYGVPPLLLP
jgi:hypothetical protein